MMKRTLIAALAATCALPAFAQEAPYPVLRAPADGLEGYTLYTPVGLPDAPALVYGHGSCRATHAEAIPLLTALAQEGYAIVAIGAPDSFDGERRQVDPSRMIAALDWLEGDAAAAQIGGTPQAFATIGWSCGGVEAMMAGSDPRVATAVGLATGFFVEPDPNGRIAYLLEELDKLSVPLLIATGGESDIAYTNALANYEYATVPAALIVHESAGHEGLVTGEYEGGTISGAAIADTVDFVTDWLDWQLKGDASAGEAAFLAEDCTWCGAPWSVEAKGF